MILAGLVLLAACVNMTNLMLARATARQRDYAVRLAIGAGGGRLIRQTLTEAMVLVGAGATLGIVFARFGEAALAAFFAEGRQQDCAGPIAKFSSAVFTLSVAVVSGLALGILPAVRVSRLDPARRTASRLPGIGGKSRFAATRPHAGRFASGAVHSIARGRWALHSQPAQARDSRSGIPPRRHSDHGSHAGAADVQHIRMARCASRDPQSRPGYTGSTPPVGRP